ncbi:MAG TPA: c-type cytochrome [Steroidobacteraceae bacterium]|nr:c-type cytochrome [Steroidobacteraceae bacterium]
MTEQPPPDRVTRRARVRLMLAAATLVLASAIALQLIARHRLEADLVRAAPEAVLRQPALVRVALALGRATYAARCAGCHGTDLKGARARGIPDLEDRTWLYGFGDVADIETTVLYGIRSGHPKSRNITDMPALGRIGQLSPAEIRDVVEYVYSLSHRDFDAVAAKHGYALFNDKGSCYDCHGTDASGNIDYGAPDLTGTSWLYGGDRATLTDSVTNGRHGLCPAWIFVLDPVRIRALAVYLYLASHPGTGVSS